MKNAKIIEPDEITVEFMPGSNIGDAVREACFHAQETGQKVRFSFNGVQFLISKNSIVADCIDEYWKRSKPITGE